MYTFFPNNIIYFSLCMGCILCRVRSGCHSEQYSSSARVLKQHSLTFRQLALISFFFPVTSLPFLSLSLSLSLSLPPSLPLSIQSSNQGLHNYAIERSHQQPTRCLPKTPCGTLIERGRCSRQTQRQRPVTTPQPLRFSLTRGH